MQAEMIAPTIEKTEEQLKAEIWDMLVQAGRDATLTSDDTKWTRGRLAVEAAKVFAVDKDGKPDEKQRRFVLKKFAVDIGMIDNPRYIYDLHDTAAFWDESAQAHYRDCCWSAFRETSRHKLTPEQARAVMDQHGHAPVAAIRQAITGKPRPSVQRVEFEAKLDPDERGVLYITTRTETDAFHKLLADHPEHVVKVVIEYIATGPA